MALFKYAVPVNLRLEVGRAIADYRLYLLTRSGLGARSAHRREADAVPVTGSKTRNRRPPGQEMRPFVWIPMLVIGMFLPLTIAFSTQSAIVRRIGALRQTLSRLGSVRMTSQGSLKDSYEALCEKLRTISHLEGIMGLLGWDEQVMMPPGAEMARGKQKAALALKIHEAKVDKEIGELVRNIESSGAQLDEVMRANIREAKLRFERNRRMPSSLAAREAELATTAYGIWVKAREQSNFAIFAPVLNETIELRKQICRITKPEMQLYDAAIDSFDPRMTADRLAEIFDEVKEQLPPLIRRISDKVSQQPELQASPSPPRSLSLLHP